MAFILTLSGMSTSGKSTLAKQLTDTGHFEEVVSLTTRPPRLGERNGVDYHFVTAEQFDQHVQDGLMLEHVKTHNAQYGVASSEVDRILASGKSVVMVLDPAGAKSVMEYSHAKELPHQAVFLNVPFELLLYRFFNRMAQVRDVGDEVNFDAEAKRMQAILQKELYWHNSLEWNVVLDHTANRAGAAVSRFVSAHEQGLLRATKRPDTRLAIPELVGEIPLESLSRMLEGQLNQPQMMNAFGEELLQLSRDYLTVVQKPSRTVKVHEAGYKFG